MPPFDRAVADRSGIYHLFAGSRAACLGRFTESRWCETQVSRSGAEPVSDVAKIPLELRCDRAAGRWPPQIDGTGPRAEIRRRLVEELGCGCATCPDPWATKIDHDHLTGLVRGYLCGACNTVVELCRHLSGCRFADYLANPRPRLSASSTPVGGRSSRVPDTSPAGAASTHWQSSRLSLETSPRTRAQSSAMDATRCSSL